MAYIVILNPLILGGFSQDQAPQDVLGGWLQNRLGGRRLWMASLVVFLVGSVLCSLAWDVSSLIVFRVVQGIGAGAMMPLLTPLLM
ncbi:MFS transporter, partial [Bacillus sp. S34]|nr:MFS transporter [Bacillus sp. S34]